MINTIKMTKFFSIFFCGFLGMFINAQKLNSYQFVNIPSEFSGKRMNSYGLKDQLVADLKAKNYTIVEGSIDNWPSELRNNPCSVAIANLDNVSSWVKNRVKIEIKDCKGNVVDGFEGGSDLKDFETGFKEAQKNALRGVKISNPTSNLVVNTNDVVDTSKNEVTFSTMEKKEEQLTMQKVNLSDTQFILVKPNSSNPYATFTKADKEGIYRVVLENKEIAFGYSDKNKLVIEIPQKDGSYVKQIITIK